MNITIADDGTKDNLGNEDLYIQQIPLPDGTTANYTDNWGSPWPRPDIPQKSMTTKDVPWTIFMNF